MSRLFEEVPEAREFCDEIIGHVSDYRLHDRESFSELFSSVLSTSQIDMQGDAFAPNALEQMAAQVSREPVWLGFNHDPLVPPLGRIVAAKVFFAPQSQLYFMTGVIGRYEASSYTSFATLQPQSGQLATADIPRPEGPLATLAFNPHEISADDVRDVLEDAPDFVARKPVFAFRKAADPIVVITVIVSAWLLTKNPFTEKFLQKHGEAAGELSLGLMKWLKGKVLALIARLRKPRVLLEIHSPFNNCLVDFVVDSQDVTVLTTALEHVQQACPGAYALVMQVKEWEPQRVVYVWEKSIGKWLPLYVTSKRGVITDRPYLLAVEWRGLSVAGTARVVNQRVE